MSTTSGRPLRLRSIAVACIAASVMLAGGATAQSRASLADRVGALEARLQQNQSEQSVAQLNRIAQLESDVKSLRALVEQMQNAEEEAKQRGRQQYIDLDSRLSRLEGGTGAIPVKPATAPAVKPAVPTAVAASPSMVPTAVPTSAPPANAAGEQPAYDAALAAIRADQYADAANRFNDFVQQYPNSGLAPNAYYWMGESYYVTQNYELALAAFKTVVDHYPDSPKTSGALLKIGYCQDALKRRDAAEATLHEVIQRYPDSDVATQAQSRLRAMDMDAGH